MTDDAFVILCFPIVILNSFQDLLSYEILKPMPAGMASSE